MTNGTSLVFKEELLDAMANYHGKGKRTMNEDVNFLLKIEHADFPLLCWFTRVYSIGICGKQWEISVSPSIFSKGRALQKGNFTPFQPSKPATHPVNVFLVGGFNPFEKY